MKVYLTKQNRKSIDFVLLETDDKFVRKSTGKVGKSGIGNSTLHAGSPENAKIEADKQIKEYQNQGYIVSELPNVYSSKDEIFDKAKWHINERFPDNLDPYQSYIHTGLYVAWLIDNNLFEEDFKNDHIDSIQKHLDRRSTPVEFYELQLDGVFDSEGLIQEAVKFTKDYFDFEKGNYINDYISTLDTENRAASIFHISDTWENYDRLKPILDKRLHDWKIKNNNR
jgi:hypothetical protein